MYTNFTRFSHSCLLYILRLEGDLGTSVAKLHVFRGATCGLAKSRSPSIYDPLSLLKRRRNEMETFKRRFNTLKNRKFFKYGLPFLLLIVGGSFGLKEFSSVRYQFSKKQLLKQEDLEKHGIHMKKPGEVTLDKEYEKIKSLDIENWEQIRGPRPWEESIK